MGEKKGNNERNLFTLVREMCDAAAGMKTKVCACGACTEKKKFFLCTKSEQRACLLVNHQRKVKQSIGGLKCAYLPVCAQPKKRNENINKPKPKRSFP